MTGTEIVHLTWLYSRYWAIGNQVERSTQEIPRSCRKEVQYSSVAVPCYPLPYREMTPEDLQSVAINRDQMTEARAYIGMDLLISGHTDKAMEHLRWVLVRTATDSLLNTFWLARS